MISACSAYLRRHHLAALALFVALGGTSYAAIQLPANSVGSKQIRSGAVSTKELRAGAVTPGKLNRKARSALRGKTGPSGAPGPAGARGPQGPKGDTGTVDTSDFYTKGQSDARFLPLNGTATDSELLDGLDSEAFIQGSGGVRGTHGQIPEAGAGILDIDGVRLVATCGTSQAALTVGNLTTSPVSIFDQKEEAAYTIPAGNSQVLSTTGVGESTHTVVQVAWGPSLERVTTFVGSVVRPVSGCPARFWATGVTTR